MTNPMMKLIEGWVLQQVYQLEVVEVVVAARVAGGWLLSESLVGTRCRDGFEDSSTAGSDGVFAGDLNWSPDDCGVVWLNPRSKLGFVEVGIPTPAERMSFVGTTVGLDVSGTSENFVQDYF